MQAWAWGGVTVYGALCVLNVFWFKRVLAMLARTLHRARAAGASHVPLEGPPSGSGPRVDT